MDDKEKEIRRKIRQILLEEANIAGPVKPSAWRQVLNAALITLVVGGGVLAWFLGAAGMEEYERLIAERDVLRFQANLGPPEPDYGAIVSVITGYSGEHDPRSPVYQWAVRSYKRQAGLVETLKADRESY